MKRSGLSRAAKIKRDSCGCDHRVSPFYRGAKDQVCIRCGACPHKAYTEVVAGSGASTVEKRLPIVSNRNVGKRLLNVREAAEYLGLRVDTVYKKARLRELPYVKVGRALRFDVQALEHFVEQHTIQTIE